MALKRKVLMTDYLIPESVTPSVEAGCKSLISICFSKIAGAPIGSPQFWGSKEESMACALRRYGVTDSGYTPAQKLHQRSKFYCNFLKQFIRLPAEA
jgi:hypothetical protein